MLMSCFSSIIVTLATNSHHFFLVKKCREIGSRVCVNEYDILHPVFIKPFNVFYHLKIDKFMNGESVFIIILLTNLLIEFILIALIMSLIIKFAIKFIENL